MSNVLPVHSPELSHVEPGHYGVMYPLNSFGIDVIPLSAVRGNVQSGVAIILDKMSDQAEITRADGEPLQISHILGGAIRDPQVVLDEPTKSLLFRRAPGNDMWLPSTTIAEGQHPALYFFMHLLGQSACRQRAALEYRQQRAA